MGATGSIVDIVGAAICFDYLDIDKVLASKVDKDFVIPNVLRIMTGEINE